MKLLRLFIFISLTCITINAQKLMGDSNKSTITYNMSHPLHDWKGISKQINTALVLNDDQTIKQIAAQVKIASFDSQNSNRDSHMIEVTEALKYPYITFTSNKIIEKNTTLEIDGILTFHNIKKNIHFEAFKKTTDSHLILEGNFTYLLSQFNIEKPSLMGISTDDLVKINFKILYKK